VIDPPVKDASSYYRGTDLGRPQRLPNRVYSEVAAIHRAYSAANRKLFSLYLHQARRPGISPRAAGAARSARVNAHAQRETRA